ncbi:dUMP phosphatase, partial [Pasteurella multocida subsp. multocida str. Anand1_cattle]
FSDYGVDFQQSDFTEFQRVNKPLWVQYQQAEISAEQLQVTRFASWAKRLNKIQ